MFKKIFLRGVIYFAAFLFGVLISGAHAEEVNTKADEASAQKSKYTSVTLFTPQRLDHFEFFCSHRRHKTARQPDNHDCGH